MQEKMQSISRRESYVPNRFTRFLWWLSTAESDLLADCMVDRNRYSIVGMTVLATWTFATLAWTYFFSTVVSNLWAAALLGLLMGGIILTIDRALIKGINRLNKRSWVSLLFRGGLAMVIGLFMAQPALLYLFNKEIHVQISLDNEQRKKEKREKQDAAYVSQRTGLVQKKNEWEKLLSSKYQEVALAREAFIKETDGTGGSKKIGLKAIAAVKQTTYLQLTKDYMEKAAELAPLIQKTDSSLAMMDVAIWQEQQVFDQLLNDGFITRIEALNHLVKDNSAVAFRYYLLVAILLLIELMPVIAKTMLPAGSYDEKVLLREQIEKELTRKNHQREFELQELYNQSAFEHDSNFITQFFAESSAERKEMMLGKINNWKQTKDSSFDTLWADMKKNLLTKQEN